jgi:hypothetical protein
MSQKPPSSEHNSSDNALRLLDSLLRDSGHKRVGKDQVILILDALASSADPALVERFTAVLAICVRNDIQLDGQALLSRYWESSPKRQNLEKLMLISVALFEQQKMLPPGNLKRIAAGLKRKYPPVALSGGMQLSTGVHVSLQGLEDTLRRFGLLSVAPAPVVTPATPSTPASGPVVITAEVKKLLSLLFSPKQQELILKKLNGEPMTKTEREYYSRTSKKKLVAILDNTVQDIARRLCD